MTMRTTVEIPDRIMRRAKAAAALEGKSLKAYLTEAVIEKLEGPKTSRKRVKLPLIPSKRPGTLKLDSDTVARILSEEDLHVLAGH